MANADSAARTVGDPDNPVAVIDVGTNSIRMAIAEIDDQGSVRTLANFSQAVNLGKDTFTNGTIQRATIEQCVRVLTIYKKALTEFQIASTDKVRVVATSAVREARNRLAFADRIFIATGLQVVPIDEAEVNRITFLGVHPFIPVSSDHQTMVVEIGGGSTETLVVREGNVAFADSYRLGSLRLRQSLESVRARPAELRRLMCSQIQRTVDRIHEQVRDHANTDLIALGGDVRFAVSQLLPQWNQKQLARLPLTDLENLSNSLLQMKDDDLVQRYHITYPDAETLGPALLAYVLLAKSFGLNEIHVSNVNLRDGLLKEMALKDVWTDEFREQIIRSATSLGEKFDYDEPHAKHTAELAVSIFRQTAELHQLGQKEEVILHLASLLHNVGSYVNNRSMHKHSMYLIRNSELFGVSETDQLLVALVARYHRRASPQPNHDGYSSLLRHDRITVAKLAAILRIAIALDESRSQRLRDVSCHIEEDRVVITIPGVDDLALEQIAVRQQATMFDEIFGRQVLLRPKR